MIVTVPLLEPASAISALPAISLAVSVVRVPVATAASVADRDSVEATSVQAEYHGVLPVAVSHAAFAVWLKALLHKEDPLATRDVVATGGSPLSPLPPSTRFCTASPVRLGPLPERRLSATENTVRLVSPARLGMAPVSWFPATSKSWSWLSPARTECFR